MTVQGVCTHTMGTLDRATLEQDYYSRSSPLEALKLGVSVKKKKIQKTKRDLTLKIIFLEFPSWHSP